MLYIFAKEYYATDVLVIGSGAAGSLAAIRANQKGKDVMIVCKGAFGAGNTVMAPGGFESSIGHEEPKDNCQIYFDDTIKAGGYINNQKVVRAMTKEMLEIPFDLDKWGCDLPKRKDGKFKQHLTSAITYPRVMDIRDETGRVLTNAFKNEIQRRDIAVMGFTIIIRLLKNKERVVGAIGYHTREQKLLIFRSKAVVLAAGGGGHIFKVTDNNFQITGDGYGLAYKAGAELVDMEMIEFQLTTCNPNVGHRPAKTTQLLMRGGRLLNGKCERFMKKINPEGFEKTTRANINRSVFLEIMEGRGNSRGGVYLDLSSVPDDELRRVIPSIMDRFERKGIDLRWQPMELYPGVHTFLGGTKIDESGRTSVPGLYAAGEVAGGVHGANRLGGNALSAAMGFGSIAGKTAADSCGKTELAEINADDIKEEEKKIKRILDRTDGFELLTIKDQLKDIMGQHINLARTEEGLKQAIAEIENLKEKFKKVYVLEGKQKIKEVYETESMLVVTDIIARAALLRQESRGVHYRLDYPETDKQWERNIVIQLDDDKPSIKTLPVIIE